MIVLTAFIALLFVYSMFSRVAESRNLTAPMIFTFSGAVISATLLEMHDFSVDTEFFLTIAEMGLVFLLFTDGMHAQSVYRRGLNSICGRLLSAGMLLTIGLGLLFALAIFDELSVWDAAILAAILAPTDAGLGQAIMSNPSVPIQIRQSLNVEAGLNDGLSVPFLLFFIGMAASHEGGSDISLHRYFIEQFGYGVVIGVAVGHIGNRLFEAANPRGWIAPGYRQLGFAALPALCIILAEPVGASMFITAFVAGIAARQKEGEGIAEHSLEFIENWGQLINLTVFFLFGILVAGQWENLKPSHFLYGALSLTVIRMLPVAVSMMGMKLQKSTILFMGWFGPRGLASIVLGLVYLEHSAEHSSAAINTIMLCVIATVLLSIVLHGITAGPGARAYSSAIANMPPDAPEVTPLNR